MEVRTLGEYMNLRTQGYDKFYLKGDKLYTENGVARFFKAIAEKIAGLWPGAKADIRDRTGNLARIESKMQELKRAEEKASGAPARPLHRLPTAGPETSMSRVNEATRRQIEVNTGEKFGVDTPIYSTLDRNTPISMVIKTGKVAQKGLTVVPTLTKGNIGPDVIMKQGMNTCFMCCIFNAMMTSKTGREILKDRIDDNGQLTQPKSYDDDFNILDDSNKPAPARKRGIFSAFLNKLEGSALAIAEMRRKNDDLLKNVSEEWKEGRQQDTVEFVKLAFPELKHETQMVPSRYINSGMGAGVSDKSMLYDGTGENVSDKIKGKSLSEIQKMKDADENISRIKDANWNDISKKKVDVSEVKASIMQWTRERLAAGQIGVYYERSEIGSGGHYMAIVGVTDDDKLIVRDSLNGKEYPTDLKCVLGRNHKIDFFSFRAEEKQQREAYEAQKKGDVA